MRAQIPTAQQGFLVALAQPVDGEQGLLGGRLHGHEAHVRATRSLADGRGVFGVVLAAFAGHAIGRDEVAGDQSRVQAVTAQLARPVVSAATDLHRDDATRGQLRAPGGELVDRQGFGSHHAACCIDGVNLDHALGQIDADSGNLVYGLPLSQARRLTIRTINLGASTPLARRWEVPSYSFGSWSLSGQTIISIINKARKPMKNIEVKIGVSSTSCASVSSSSVTR